MICFFIGSLIWCIGWLQTSSAPKHCCPAANAKQMETVAITFILRKLLKESDSVFFSLLYLWEVQRVCQSERIQVLHTYFFLWQLWKKSDDPRWEFFQTPKSKWWCVCPAQCFGRFLHFSCTFSLIPFRLKRNDPAWRPDFPQLLSRLPVLPLWLLRSPPPRGRAFLHV